MKILYLTSPVEDYLQDQILIGLREIYGVDVVDYPKKNVVYQTYDRPNSEMYGNGFSIWKTLPDIDVDRDAIFDKLNDNYFDIIIFGSIWNQKAIFKKIRKNWKAVFNTKLVFLDGQDDPYIYKQAAILGHYYKRELIKPLHSFMAKPISFSIPDSKINQFDVEKSKLFATHVQCDEAYKIDEIRNSCQKSYAFSDEDEYYQDIARSYYAITMKKAGWDCMRHNEIAANGTVPCFYRFTEKPKSCAPHGLVDMKNILSFDTAEELMEKINIVKENNLYESMRENVLKWAREHSCRNAAQHIINDLR